MVQEPKAPCILCGKGWEVCRCAFKKPTKDKRAFSYEIYTTSPRTFEEMFEILNCSFPASLKDGSKCIFKITVHKVKY